MLGPITRFSCFAGEASNVVPSMIIDGSNCMVRVIQGCASETAIRTVTLRSVGPALVARTRRRKRGPSVAVKKSTRWATSRRPVMISLPSIFTPRPRCTGISIKSAETTLADHDLLIQKPRAHLPSRSRPCPAFATKRAAKRGRDYRVTREPRGSRINRRDHRQRFSAGRWWRSISPGSRVRRP